MARNGNVIETEAAGWVSRRFWLRSYLRAVNDDRDQLITFERTEGAIRHRFIRHGPVAPHVALTSGATPRVVIAFPAANRVILLSGDAHDRTITFDLAGPLVALSPATDGVGSALVPITADAPEVRFTRVVLGSMRTIRDVGYGVMPTARLSGYATVVTGPAHDHEADRVRPTKPVLAAPFAGLIAPARVDAIEPRFTTVPRPARRIDGTTALMPRNVPGKDVPTI
jgi:hypothetical protein